MGNGLIDLASVSPGVVVLVVRHVVVRIGPDTVWWVGEGEVEWLVGKLALGGETLDENVDGVLDEECMRGLAVVVDG